MHIVGSALRRRDRSRRQAARLSGLLRVGGALAFMLLSCGVGIASTVCPSERAKPLLTDRPDAVRGARAVRAQPARAAARRLSGQARAVPAQLLPPRRSVRLDSATSTCATPARSSERSRTGNGPAPISARTRRSSPGTRPTWYDVAEGQPRGRACRPAAAAAGSRRRDHGQGDVPAAGRRLRERRSAAPVADVGRRRHGARRRRLATTAGSGAGSAGARTTGGRTGRRRRATTIPTWATACTAPTVTHRRATTHTFASLRNIKGERGDPLVFLSQTFVTAPLFESFHEAIAQGASPKTEPPPEPPYPSLFTRFFRLAEQGAADQRDRRQHAVGNLRPCLGARPARRTRDRRW